MRRESLKEIEQAGDLRAVPSLLALLAAGDSLSGDAARTIAALVGGATAAQLAWLDEQARSGSWTYGERDAWWHLTRDRIPLLAQMCGCDAAAIGMLAMHRSGFVRAAAVQELSGISSGDEIPFLALRANDWVEPVADAARGLLVQRLRAENRVAVLNALPFILRMLGQQRRDHRDVREALRDVLMSDDGHSALAAARTFPTAMRRTLYELILTDTAGPDSGVLRAALEDDDPVVRGVAVKRLSSPDIIESAAPTLVHLLIQDPVPVIRKNVLSLIADRLPSRLPDVLTRTLLDRSGAVRELARFLVRTHPVPIVPKDVYIAHLSASLPHELAAAIAGLGETGTVTDAERMSSFLQAAFPRVRRAALFALSKLDPERALPAALRALGDGASSVRRAGVAVLIARAHQVDFSEVSRLWETLTPASARRSVLRLLREAPKWDAAIFLLRALADPDQTVRTMASQWLDSWVADFNRSQTPPSEVQLQKIRSLLNEASSAMSTETADLLRFAVKTR